MGTTSASGRASRRSRRIVSRIGLTVAAASLATALFAGSALANTYPSGPDARDFHKSNGSWSEAVSYKGVCLVPGVTCARGEADWVSSGGAGGTGDGYLRTRVNTVAGVLSGVAVPWRSSQFTVPKKLAFTHARGSYHIRSDIATLVNLGGTAKISMRLRDFTHPLTSFNANTRYLKDVSTFAPSGFNIPTNKLTAGDTYQMILRVDVRNPLLTVPTLSEIDIDDVALTLTH